MVATSSRRTGACALALLSLIATAACKREPAFDERYAATNARISETAREIDARIAGTGAPMEDATEPPIDHLR